MELINIQLTDNEAKAFVRFQKHRALIEMLEKLGVFDLHNGSCEIHFNSFGAIVGVDKHEFVRV